MRLYVDGEVFRWQRIGGISRLFLEILPRIARAENDLELTVAVQGAVRLEMRRTLAPWYERIPSVPTNWRPWRFWRIVSPVLNKMLWDRYWRGRELDVFMSTYYTVLPVRVPSVCVVHDMIFELFPGSFDKTLATETLEKQRRAIAKADRLICVSECTRQDVIKIHQVDASKCRVVYHASGIMRKVPDGEKNSKEFLYVGDILSKYKNFEFLIRCLGSPEFSEFGEYKLRVVSTCELNATDMSRFSEYLPTARMQFVANCTDDELAGYYATCAAFIYPSLYEGFGIPILEALSYGAPVVSSTGGALPEAGGEVVYYFDPKSEDGLREALRRALADGRAPQLVKKRKEHAGRFSWDKTAEKFLAVLREVAGEKKSVKCKV